MLKMNQCFLFAYLLLSITSTFAQQPYLEGTTPYLDYKTLESMHLKGAVKQITETSYKATMVNGQFVKGAKGWQNTWDYDMVFVFDANGFLTTEKELLSGSYQVKRSTKIDSLKRVVQTTLGQSAHYYTYDSLGRISKSKEINGETTAVRHYLYLYDTNGFLSRKESPSSSPCCAVNSHPVSFLYSRGRAPSSPQQAGECATLHKPPLLLRLRCTSLPPSSSRRCRSNRGLHSLLPQRAVFPSPR